MKVSDVELPSNRKFGLFFTAVFLLFGGYSLFWGTPAYGYVAFVFAVVIFMVTLIKDELLQPLNMLWMKLGLLLGKIVSPIVLGVLFFGLFVPLALVMKLFGRDELGVKFQTRLSYWKERDPAASKGATFKTQY